MDIVYLNTQFVFVQVHLYFTVHIFLAKTVTPVSARAVFTLGVGYDAHWHLFKTVHYRRELNAHREHSTRRLETRLERGFRSRAGSRVAVAVPLYCLHSSACGQETQPEDEYTSVEDRETVDSLPSSHCSKTCIHSLFMTSGIANAILFDAH